MWHIYLYFLLGIYISILYIYHFVERLFSNIVFSGLSVVTLFPAFATWIIALLVLCALVVLCCLLYLRCEWKLVFFTLNFESKSKYLRIDLNFHLRFKMYLIQFLGALSNLCGWSHSRLVGRMVCWSVSRIVS